MRKKCEHDKRKDYCKECNGAAICIHKRIKYDCKDCNGTRYCQHKKDKRNCIDCDGSGLCIHKRIKYQCIECDGVSLCIHKERKYRCKKCIGSGICIHGNEKVVCVECEGSQICIHKKQKRYCIECRGNSICIHDKAKTRCKICDVSDLCKSDWCETRGNGKFDGYCLNCYVHLFPDNPICRNYKTKEKAVVDFTKEVYPDFTWVTDKKVQDGCSKRRPDLLLDLGHRIIIIEVDENQHKAYDETCENKRLMELWQDVYHRPIVFIKFNPDSYEEDGEKIESCWKIDKNLGILKVSKKKEEEWKDRLNYLKDMIKYWTKKKTEKSIEIVKLFYDD